MLIPTVEAAGDKKTSQNRSNPSTRDQFLGGVHIPPIEAGRSLMFLSTSDTFFGSERMRFRGTEGSHDLCKQSSLPWLLPSRTPTVHFCEIWNLCCVRSPCHCSLISNSQLFFEQFSWMSSQLCLMPSHLGVASRAKA